MLYIYTNSTAINYIDTIHLVYTTHSKGEPKTSYWIHVKVNEMNNTHAVRRYNNPFILQNQSAIPTSFA